MNSYYASSAYEAKFAAKTFFATADGARRHDRLAAAAIVAETTQAELVRAMEAGDEALEEALGFVLEEIRYARPIAAA